MRSLDSPNESPSRPSLRHGRVMWPELALVGLALPAILDEALRWLRPPSATMSTPGIWFLVELFGSLAVGVVAAVLAPVVAGIAAWGIASGRWRGLHAFGAYALALVNLRTLLFMCVVFFGDFGSPGVFHVFHVAFLLVVPSVYLGARAWRSMWKQRAA